jgi:hypothetical protein
VSTDRSTLGVFAVTLILGVAASGCAAGGGDKGNEPALGQIAVVTGPVNPALPLDGYALNKRDYLVIQRAAWQAINRCVSRFGVTYTAQPPSAEGMPPMSGDNGGRYGLMDKNSAAVRGYRFAGAANSPEGDKGGRWNPSPTEVLIVRGAGTGAGTKAPVDAGGKPLPAGGCLAEATALTETGTNDPGKGDVALKLAKDTYERSFRDSRTVAAEAHWSSCMKKAGFSFATSRDANNYRWPNPVGPEEKAAAKADVECKISTNLVGIWWAVETAHQKKSLEDDAATLKQVKDFNDNQVKNAARILAG